MNLTATMKYDRLAPVLEALGPAVREAVKIAIRLSTERIVNCMKIEAPVDTGHLKSRIRAREKAGSDGLIWIIISDAKQRVSSAGPYPSFQEFGTYHNVEHPYFFPCIKKLQFVTYGLMRDGVARGIKDAGGGNVGGSGGGGSLGSGGGGGSGGSSGGSRKPKYSKGTLIGFAQLQDKLRKMKKIR